MTELDRARAALDSLDAGCDRETWVRVAMAAKAAGLDEEDFVAWSEGAPNFQSERDCRTVWRSVKGNGGIGAGTLFGLAQAAGWRDEKRHNGHSHAPRFRSKDDRRPPFDFLQVWESSEPATAAHPYIKRKLGLWGGLRVYRGPVKVAGQALDGALLVPAYDDAGALQTWQAIPAEAGARKLNAPGRAVAGWFVVGPPPQGAATVYVVEGIGCAWSAHQATRAPAVVAFGAGRVEAVALALKKGGPNFRLVIVADVGKEKDAERIARLVRGAWVAPPADLGNNGDLNDLHQRDGLEAAAALLERASAPAYRFRLLTAGELAALPPVRWCVSGVLPAEGLAAIFGPPACGKSFLTLDALGAVAASRPWFGYRTRAVPVTYVALEGEAGIAQRVAAFRSRHGAVPAALRFVTQPFALLAADDIAELAEAIRAAGGAGGVVAIDTLNRAAAGADENDARDMGALIAGAKALQTALGGLVLLVHHGGKDPTRGLRGHSSLHAALDAVVEVTRDGERREWRIAKSKDGADGEPHPFRLAVLDLGEDDEGEPVSSCVVEPEQPASEAFRRALPPKAGNQKLAWDVLGEVLRAAGDVRPDGAPKALPVGRPCVRLETAVHAVRGRLVCEPKRRTERATQAVQGLINRGLLAHAEGWLWCT